MVRPHCNHVIKKINSPSHSGGNIPDEQEAILEGGKPAFAVHLDMQEVFIVLNGTVEMTVTDMTCTLDGGDAILISPREIHSMKNVCDSDVEYIVFGISTEQGGKTVNV